jgi:hypothetical protein
MLGRENYTQEELDHARTAPDTQLAAYNKLVNAIGGAASDPAAASAAQAFEPLFFNNMTMVLDATSCTGSAWSPARTATR